MTNQTTRQLLRWTPRALALLYAGFISLFALDVWGMDGTVWERLGGFLIHLAPTYAVVVALIVGWRWPAAGGALFMVLVLVFSIFFGWAGEWQTWLLLGLPLVIVGLLFLGDAWPDRKRLQPRL
jgi:hypothetical protein